MKTASNTLLNNKSMTDNTSIISPDMENPMYNLDCSQAVDIINEKRTQNFDLTELGNVLLSSLLFCPEISKRLQLTLTTDHLIFCSENNENNNYLIYNPIQIKYISIRTVCTENDLIGEYSFQFLIQKQKLLTMASKSIEERNMWLGKYDKNSQSFSSWKPLSNIVEYYNMCRNSAISKYRNKTPEPIRTNDIFTISTDQSEGISPLNSSDESEEGNSVNFLNYSPYAPANNTFFEGQFNQNVK